MIITRTPFRLTLGGGGTDLPSFYHEHGGFLLAVGIDKYMFINANTPIVDDKIRIRYTKSELVDHVDEVQHTLAREALKAFSLTKGIEVVSLADIPAGTGLGSSSCYLVGLLNALHALMQKPATAQELAEEACHIELSILKKPIGKQDQYMAAFGGLTSLTIDRRGKVQVQKSPVSADLVENLENNLLLFFTHETRDATAILTRQDGETRKKNAHVVGNLREIKDIGIEIHDEIVKGNLRRFGELMDLHWQTKKRLSRGITNPQIDAWYTLARRNGAIGGKIAGAGGGGFLMLYCEEKKQRLREAMRKAGLRELNFRFEFEGSKVVFDIVSRDQRLAHNQRLRDDSFATGPKTVLIANAS
ncbi:MAG TPA: galactokinase [Patescibacteria group bacterium]|nr:galactokinase [Patescibacteria group bacterium]